MNCCVLCARSAMAENDAGMSRVDSVNKGPTETAGTSGDLSGSPLGDRGLAPRHLDPSVGKSLGFLPLRSVFWG